VRIVGDVFALVGANTAGIKIESGLVQWAGTGLWLFGLVMVGRGFTAKRRLQNDYGETRMKALAVLEPTYLIPVLSDIVLFVHNRVEWGLSRLYLGQPEDRVPVEISHNDLAPVLRELRAICADASDLDVLQDHLVGHVQRQGLWALLFLPAWGYIVLWASVTGLDLPVALTVACYGLACLSFGAALCERVAEAKAGERFAELQRRYEGGGSS